MDWRILGLVAFGVCLFFLTKPENEKKVEPTLTPPPTNQADTRDQEKEFVLENKQEVKETVEDSAKIEVKENVENLTAEFKTNFISGCVEGGTTDYKTCECMFNYFLDTFGMDKFMQFSLQMISGEVSDELATAITTAVYRCQ